MKGGEDFSAAWRGSRKTVIPHSIGWWGTDMRRRQRWGLAGEGGKTPRCHDREGERESRHHDRGQSGLGCLAKSKVLRPQRWGPAGEGGRRLQHDADRWTRNGWSLSCARCDKVLQCQSGERACELPSFAWDGCQGPGCWAIAMGVRWGRGNGPQHYVGGDEQEEEGE